MSRGSAFEPGRSPRQSYRGSVTWELGSQNRSLQVREASSTGIGGGTWGRLWDICPSRRHNVPACQRVITSMAAGFPIY